MWTRVDDIDGTEAQQVTFGLDGTAYTIDLGNIEHEKLRGVLKRFIDVAQPYGEMPVPPAREEQPVSPAGRPGPRTQARRAAMAQNASSPAKKTPPARKRSLRKSAAAAPVPKATVTQLDGRRVRKAKDGGTPHAVIRVWAGGNGYQVQPKGRIPAEVIRAFEEAQR
jgi:hypothetical protein